MSKKNKGKKEIFGIIGLGRFGMALAKELCINKKDVICCDIDEKKVKEMLEYTDNAYVVDDSSIETLKSIGFETCSTVVVAIGEEMSKSILTTLNVISLQIPKVIAKATNNEQGQVLKILGAEVIYPERDIALRLAKKIINRNVMDFLSLNNEIEINEIIIPSKLIGVSVLDSNIRHEYGLNIIAIEHNGEIRTDIDVNYIFAENDKIVVIGKKDSVKEFRDIQ